MMLTLPTRALKRGRESGSSHAEASAAKTIPPHIPSWMAATMDERDRRGISTGPAKRQVLQADMERPISTSVPTGTRTREGGIAGMPVLPVMPHRSKNVQEAVKPVGDSLTTVMTVAGSSDSNGVVNRIPSQFPVAGETRETDLGTLPGVFGTDLTDVPPQSGMAEGRASSEYLGHGLETNLAINACPDVKPNSDDELRYGLQHGTPVFYTKSGKASTLLDSGKTATAVINVPQMNARMVWEYFTLLKTQADIHGGGQPEDLLQFLSGESEAGKTVREKFVDFLNGFQVGGLLSNPHWPMISASNPTGVYGRPSLRGGKSVTQSTTIKLKGRITTPSFWGKNPPNNPNVGFVLQRLQLDSDNTEMVKMLENYVIEILRDSRFKNQTNSPRDLEKFAQGYMELCRTIRQMSADSSTRKKTYDLRKSFFGGDRPWKGDASGVQPEFDGDYPDDLAEVTALATKGISKAFSAPEDRRGERNVLPFGWGTSVGKKGVHFSGCTANGGVRAAEGEYFGYFDKLVNASRLAKLCLWKADRTRLFDSAVDESAGLLLPEGDMNAMKGVVDGSLDVLRELVGVPGGIDALWSTVPENAAEAYAVKDARKRVEGLSAHIKWLHRQAQDATSVKRNCAEFCEKKSSLGLRCDPFPEEDVRSATSTWAPPPFIYEIPGGEAWEAGVRSDVLGVGKAFVESETSLYGLTAGPLDRLGRLAQMSCVRLALYMATGYEGEDLEQTKESMWQRVEPGRLIDGSTEFMMAFPADRAGTSLAFGGERIGDRERMGVANRPDQYRAFYSIPTTQHVLATIAAVTSSISALLVSPQVYHTASVLRNFDGATSEDMSRELRAGLDSELSKDRDSTISSFMSDCPYVYVPYVEGQTLVRSEYYADEGSSEAPLKNLILCGSLKTDGAVADWSEEAQALYEGWFKDAGRHDRSLVQTDNLDTQRVGSKLPSTLFARVRVQDNLSFL